jgi:probable rRNA maturation factor
MRQPVKTQMIDVVIQRASRSGLIPVDRSLQNWAKLALDDCADICLTIRIVDAAESADLNERFRSKKGPTNVLSFAADVPDIVELPLLGDIVICAPLVAEEAVAQKKELEAHWAHLVIHGVLHLTGFDHQSETQAAAMESREIALLAVLGFPDPYN